MKLVPVEDTKASRHDDHPHNHHHDAGNPCICGTDDCDGRCVENCQCSYQALNLAMPVPLPAASAKAEAYICAMRCEGDKTYPKPGDCPVCGMHLVKVVAFGASAEEGESEEMAAFRAMRGKLILSVLLSLPVLFLSMGELIPGLKEFIMNLFPRKTNLLVQLLLSLPVVLWSASFI